MYKIDILTTYKKNYQYYNIFHYNITNYVCVHKLKISFIKVL